MGTPYWALPALDSDLAEYLFETYAEAYSK